MKRYLLWGAGLIALYIVVAHGTGFARATGAAAQGSSSLVTALQGR